MATTLSQAKLWTPGAKCLQYGIRNNLFWITNKIMGSVTITEKNIGRSLGNEKTSIQKFHDSKKGLSNGVLILTSPRIKSMFEYDGNKNGSTNSNGPKYAYTDSLSMHDITPGGINWNLMRLCLNSTSTKVNYEEHLLRWIQYHFGTSNINLTDVASTMPNLRKFIPTLHEIGIWYKILNRSFVPMVYAPDKVANDAPPNFMIFNNYFPREFYHSTNMPTNAAEFEDSMSSFGDSNYWKTITENSLKNLNLLTEMYSISRDFSMEPAYMHNPKTENTKMGSQFIYIAHDMKTKRFWILTNDSVKLGNKKVGKEALIEHMLQEGSANALRWLLGHYSQTTFTEDDVWNWNKKEAVFNIVSVF